MSIALDLALYLRDKKLENPLTLTERGLLFTLLFRVGSNPFAWVTQETLSIETDTAERNIRNLMKNIAKKGFAQIDKNPKDKRKNVYKPAEFLINYHQKRGVDKSDKIKKYRTKSSGVLKNTGRNHPVFTGRNHPVLSSVQMDETCMESTLNECVQIPKATYESNNKSKETQYCASDDAHAHFKKFWDAYPRKKNKDRSLKIWMKKRLYEKADFIISDVVKRNTTEWKGRDPQFIPHPSTYLHGERWNDEIEEHKEECKHGKTNETHAQAVGRVTKELHVRYSNGVVKTSNPEEDTTLELDYNPISAI